MSISESLLNELEKRTCDLRCRNVPTGGDDYDVEWCVVEHYMDEPKEREIGVGQNATEAMLNAFHGLSDADLNETSYDHDRVGRAT